MIEGRPLTSMVLHACMARACPADFLKRWRTKAEVEANSSAPGLGN